MIDLILFIVIAPQLVTELNSFADYNQLSIRLANREGSYFSMNSQEEQSVRAIASGSTSVAVNAQSILSLVFNEEFEYEAEPIDEISARLMNSEEQVEMNEKEEVPTIIEERIFKIYPNPSFDNTMITIFPQDYENGIIVLTDISGREIKKYLVDQGNFVIEINNKELPPGLYFCYLHSDVGLITTQKLIRLSK